MARLYWRVKVNGKWTWRRATALIDMPGIEITVEYPNLEEFE